MSRRNTRKTSEADKEEDLILEEIPKELRDFLQSGPKDKAPQRSQSQPPPGTPHPARPEALETEESAEEDAFTSPATSPHHTPLPGTPNSERDDTLTETPSAPKPKRKSIPTPPSLHSSEGSDDDSISSAASVRRAEGRRRQREAWKVQRELDEREEKALAELLAKYPIQPANPQWGRGLTQQQQQQPVDEDLETKMSTPAGHTQEGATAPAITAAAWQAQRDEMKRLQEELDKLKGPSGPRTVATQETKIPQFAGFSDDRSAEVWYQRAESVANQFGWSDQRFIEAATNCFTKSAEAWYLNEKFRAENTGSKTLKDREEFKKAFLKQFDVTKSIASQTRSLATLKQEKDENVNAYWVRVSITVNELLSEYRDERGWQPDPGSEERPSNHAYRCMVVLNNFADDKLKVMYFVHGLLPSIGEVIRPRVKEIQREGHSVLDAAREVEIAQGRNKTSAASTAASGGVAALDAIDWTDTPAATRDAVIAAFSTRGGRGGRGGGGRGGGSRGGGRGRGGRGGGQSREPNVFNIQSRERARYCQRCRQWGKHKKEECRHTDAQISAMTAMNPNQRPSWEQLHDKCYDDLDGKSESGNE